MTAVFESFQRHYRTVQSVGERLANANAFRLQLKGERDTLAGKITNYDEEDAVRLAVLMRPFLHPSHDLYYKNLWPRLLDELGEVVRPEDAAVITQAMERLASGLITITINDEILNPESIYHR